MKNREHDRRKKARTMLSKGGYAAGGHMKHPDEAEDKKLIKKEMGKARIRLRDGGMAEGNEPKPRADRMSRGGKSKHKGAHTTVNVVVAGQHPKPVPVPVPKPVPVPVDSGALAGAGGPPPGMGAGPDPNAPPPPIGLKSGGRTKRAAGGKADLKMESQRENIKGMPDGQFADGGRTAKKFPVPTEFGGGGGLGRLQKAKDYGAKV